MKHKIDKRTETRIFTAEVKNGGQENIKLALMEECAELAIATNRSLTRPHDKRVILKLAEELADVQIMMDQITRIYRCFDLEGLIRESRKEKMIRKANKLGVDLNG